MWKTAFYIPFGLIDYPTPSCFGRVNKIFNYSDFVGDAGSTLVTDAIAASASCKFELQYSITVQ